MRSPTGKLGQSCWLVRGCSFLFLFKYCSRLGAEACQGCAFLSARSQGSCDEIKSGASLQLSGSQPALPSCPEPLTPPLMTVPAASPSAVPSCSLSCRNMDVGDATGGAPCPAVCEELRRAPLLPVLTGLCGSALIWFCQSPQNQTCCLPRAGCRVKPTPENALQFLI